MDKAKPSSSQPTGDAGRTQGRRADVAETAERIAKQREDALVQATLRMLQEREAPAIQQLGTLARQAEDDWRANNPSAAAEPELSGRRAGETVSQQREREAEQQFEEFRRFVRSIAAQHTPPGHKRAELVDDILAAVSVFLAGYASDPDMVRIGMEAVPRYFPEVPDDSAAGDAPQGEGAITATPPPQPARSPAVRLPDAAPQLYRDRPIDPATGKPEDVLRFLERVWLDPWIAAGALTRPALRRLDPPCAKALENWINHSRQPLPGHLRMPTRTEVVEQELASADPQQLKEAQRLLRAFERRAAFDPRRV